MGYVVLGIFGAILLTGIVVYVKRRLAKLALQKISPDIKQVSKRKKSPTNKKSKPSPDRNNESGEQEESGQQDEEEEAEEEEP